MIKFNWVLAKAECFLAPFLALSMAERVRDQVIFNQLTYFKVTTDCASNNLLV